MLTGMPRPLPDRDTQPFWDGCRDGRFLVPRCAACGHARWPPGPMCPTCQSTDTDWIESSGRGTVYSWIVATHPVDPVLADQVPYVVAMIDLPEGVRVVGNVDGCRPEEVTAGMEVELFFSDPGEDGIPIPSFRAADQANRER
jgi:hypothetical protein